VPLRLSVVVVAYDMERELPRTLRSLSSSYQRGVTGGDYEVVVVDNGSPEPVPLSALEGLPVGSRLIRIDDAHPSPAASANAGLAEARGDIVGLYIDGARIASPGLLAHAELATRLSERAVVTPLSWHLGPATHMHASETGWDAQREDATLASIAWEEDGYRLFEVSTFAGSSARGWFGPLGESNALFLRRELWDELGGLDERFQLPGGGRVNHDLLRRASALDGTRLVVLLGEGTFHQIHGGASTSRRVTREQADADYERVVGRPFAPPALSPLYVGSVPDAALPHMERSIAWALRDRCRPGGVSRSGGETPPD
jgi:glycosyltransferase involved in cell wall biosynthesis